MGKDRQERKLRESRRVESDRNQSLQYPGATGLDTPEQARKQNQHYYYKKTVSMLYETVFCIIILMIFIYIEIIFCVLYPPITSFAPTYFPYKSKSSQKSSN